MILRAVSDSTPPPDLTVSLTLTGGKLLQPITLERAAEHLPLSPSPGSVNPPQAESSESHAEETGNSQGSECNFMPSDNKQAIFEGLPQGEKDKSSSPSPPLPVVLAASSLISPAASSADSTITHQEGTCMHVI